MSSCLGTQDRALARSRLYGLAGRVVLDGLRPETLSLARALPALSDAIPDVSDDMLAARHHRAFGWGVPPVASIFIDPLGQLGGENSRLAADLLAETGLREPRTDVASDHLGLLLRALGFCCAAQADALRDGLPAVAERLVQVQRRLLAEQLCACWAPFSVAIGALGLGEYTALVELIGEALSEHAASLGVMHALVPSSQGDALDWLDDPKTGVKRIVRWFLVPARSGLWLTRSEIEALAARIDVPSGFGERTALLESVWFAAVDHERVPQLLDALQGRLTACADSYAALDRRGIAAEHWVERVQVGLQVVARVRAGLVQ